MYKPLKDKNNICILYMINKDFENFVNKSKP